MISDMAGSLECVKLKPALANQFNSITYAQPTL
jgi:hypothetical protein